MLYRGVVLLACHASHACRAACSHRSRDDNPAHHHRLPRYRWCVGLGHSRPWCRRRWRSPSAAAAATMGAAFFFFFFSRNKKKNKTFSFSKLKGDKNLQTGLEKLFLKKKKVFVFKIKRGTKIFKRGGKNFLKRVGLFVGSIEGGKIFGVALFCFAWEWGFFLSTPRIGCPRIVGY